ncbi:unnamed protein product [Sphenostylis stenocarpa]|uniref:60S ribosomal export protein NMD3 OB-fold domain-containing protein n=1 Tax=Sphenostylis stenocarpa TaxID=92480 RepID=A0AA86RWM0_9FABA|nr:unnamed protein product [Sphenostylis stenocarpa]
MTRQRVRSTSASYFELHRPRERLATALLCLIHLPGDIWWKVLDVEVVSSEITIGGTKYRLADARVARVSDFGDKGTIFNIKTHLVHLLNPGDYSLFYDLYRANSNDMEFDMYKEHIPEAILIKKSYEEKSQKKRGKHQYGQLLKDLEEKPGMRFNISLNRNKEYQSPVMASVTDGDDLPSVPLHELLADRDGSEDEDEEDNMTERTKASYILIYGYSTIVNRVPRGPIACEASSPISVVA